VSTKKSSTEINRLGSGKTLLYNRRLTSANQNPTAAPSPSSRANVKDLDEISKLIFNGTMDTGQQTPDEL
jgi:hypothetical protein